MRMSETEGRAAQQVIKPADMDPKFKYEISRIPGGEKIMQCFQCGTCTADCPIARFSEDYRPRRIVRMMQLGLKEKLLKSDVIWLCGACFTCVDRCPQDVELASVFRVLRNLAVKEGFVPVGLKTLASNILKTGYVNEIPESMLAERLEQNLPPLPKANVESVKKIFDITGSSKILEKVI